MIGCGKRCSLRTPLPLGSQVHPNGGSQLHEHVSAKPAVPVLEPTQVNAADARLFRDILDGPGAVLKRLADRLHYIHAHIVRPYPIGVKIFYLGVDGVYPIGYSMRIKFNERNAMRQVTWQQAEEIAAKAGEKAFGWTAIEDGKTYELTGKQLRHLVHEAGFIALQKAGCLADQDRRNKAAICRAADAAERSHKAWCKTTGNRF